MSDIDILTQIERALVSDSQTQRDLAMDGAHVEIQRLRKENAILDKELVRHIRHASELISQVERMTAERDDALVLVGKFNSGAELQTVMRLNNQLVAKVEVLTMKLAKAKTAVTSDDGV